MDAINPSTIKTINIIKEENKNVIKIVTKEASEKASLLIPDDAEIFINNKKATKKELDNLDNSTIERMDVNKTKSRKTVVKVTTKNNK